MNIAKMIKIELIKKGIKHNEIAAALSISTAAVSQFIHNQERSKRFDAWVLLNLDIDLDKLRKQAA